MGCRSRWSLVTWARIMVQDKARGGKKNGRHCTARVFTDTLASSPANVRGMPTLVSAVFPFMSPCGETMAMLQKLIFIPVKLLVTSSSFAVINYQLTVAFPRFISNILLYFLSSHFASMYNRYTLICGHFNYMCHNQEDILKGL